MKIFAKHKYLIAIFAVIFGLGFTVFFASSAEAQNLLCNNHGNESSRFQIISVNKGRYKIQNNMWNDKPSGKMCLVNFDGRGFRITENNYNVETLAGPPASYPSIFAGCHWSECTVGNFRLKKKAKNIKSAKVNWSVSLPKEGDWNVVSEAWFDQRRNGDPNSGRPRGAEIMIWINHNGNVQPGGERRGTVTLEGAQWEVWVNTNASYPDKVTWNFITYKRVRPTTQLKDFDYKPFFDHATENNWINPEWYLQDIEAGFEIWRGGAGLQTKNFKVYVR